MNTLLSKLNDLANVNLEVAIEEDPDQLQAWFEWLTEFDIEDLLSAAENGETNKESIELVLRAMRFILHLEHVQAEEFKDLIDRETHENAEREENWVQEREALHDEMRTFRESLTGRAGFDNVNEAFRTEIDSLNVENESLRQQLRERDRELSDQRERMEDLHAKHQAAEKERTLLSSNQSQLEETIRELNRRLDRRDDEYQRSNWEFKKLRQRNEQALLLSERLKDVTSQNDALREEVDRLMTALSDATSIIQENAQKWKEYSEQLEQADAAINRLTDDNNELRSQLNKKNEDLVENVDKNEATSKEFAEILQAKTSKIELLSEQLNMRERELDEWKLKSESERDNREKEEELERLRLELVSATETARKLFGTFSRSDDHEATTNSGEKKPFDPTIDLRVRLVQQDMELERVDQKLRQALNERTEMKSQMEQKELANARLFGEIEKYRKIAFGDQLENVERIEKQLEFRNKEIEELVRRCSLLQIELHEYQEGVKGKSEIATDQEREEEIITKKHICWIDLKESSEIRDDEEEQATAFEEEENVEEDEEVEELFIENEEKKENEREEEHVEIGKERENVRKRASHKWTRQMNSQAEFLSSLFHEVKQLRHELKNAEKNVESMKVLHKEREKHLIKAKEDNATALGKHEELRRILFGVGDAVSESISNCNELKLAEANEALELENFELRRLFETLKTSESEFDRRAAEGAHRLVFLAIQNSKLERRAGIGERLRSAMAYEIERLESKSRREVSEEKHRIKQMALENEIKTFEIARLQNALLHSVPLSEYRRFQRELKSIAIEKVFGPDAGYFSAAEEEFADNEKDVLNSIDLTKTSWFQQSKIDEMKLKLHKLEQMNEILMEQNDGYRREVEKNKTHIKELEAFLQDIENESEIKSLIVNIERRFIQAIREQFNTNEECAAMGEELKKAQSKMQEAVHEWNSERQCLINSIFKLKTIICKLAERNQRLPNVSLQQLKLLAQRIQKLKENENLMQNRKTELEKQRLELQQKINLFQATKESVETLIANDYQMEQIKISVQSYQLSNLSLTDKLTQTRVRLKKAEKEASERGEEANELLQQLSDLKMLMNIDSKKPDLFNGDKVESVETSRNARKSPKNLDIDIFESHFLDTNFNSSVTPEEVPETTESQTLIPKKYPPRSLTVADTLTEYGENMIKIREATELCVRGYKLQLEQKEKAIEEYREMLHKFQNLSNSTILRNQQGLIESETTMSVAFKSSAELLKGEHQQDSEESEKNIRILERKMRQLIEDNEDLEDIVNKMRTEMEATRNKKFTNVGVQVDSKNGYNGSDHEDEEENEEAIVSAVSDEDASSVEGDDKKTESDSGTVDDIPKRSELGKTKLNKQAKTQNKNKEDNGSTYTIQDGEDLAVGKLEQEHEKIVLRYRNELRKLRLRYAALERQNKQLSEEYTAFKERSRYTRQKMDPNSELGLLQKENGRLAKLNADLSKSLNASKQELEEANKKLKRSEESVRSKANTEAWNERKKNENLISSLKQKIADFESRERTLNERLDRREKMIAQIERDQKNGLTDNEQIQKLSKEWKQAKEMFAKREMKLKQEAETSFNRFKEMGLRAEALTKENKSLQSKLSKMNVILSSEQSPKKDTGSQIDDVFVIDDSDKKKREEQPKIVNEQPESVSAKIDEKNASLVKSIDFCNIVEHKLLNKRLNEAEVLKIETLEQLNALKKAHDELIFDYKKSLDMEMERRRDEIIKSEKQSLLGVALLADKLKAKNREIEEQRTKIIALERKIRDFDE